MNLAIVGYGKMGRIIEQLAPEYGFSVALRLDEHNNTGGVGMTAESFRGVDVAVEFSTPSTVVENVERLAELHVNVVVGATGWTDRMARLKTAVELGGIGLVWSPNFSVGMNVFCRLAEEAARLMAPETDYGAWLWEIHHSTKKDAPSGTALKLAAGMKQAGFSRPIDVSSNRAGAHPGTHEVGFDSSSDTITLRHTVRSREGFARGALKAARWIAGKKGFFEFSQVLFGTGGE